MARTADTECSSSSDVCLLMAYIQGKETDCWPPGDYNQNSIYWSGQEDTYIHLVAEDPLSHGEASYIFKNDKYISTLAYACRTGK